MRDTIFQLAGDLFPTEDENAFSVAIAGRQVGTVTIELREGNHPDDDEVVWVGRLNDGRAVVKLAPPHRDDAARQVVASAIQGAF